MERVAIVAEGADSAEVVAWILDHDGRARGSRRRKSSKSGGLHSPRLSGPIGSEPRPPARYVLPAGALN